MTTSSRVLCTLLAGALLASACSGSGGDESGDGLAVKADGSTTSAPAGGDASGDEAETVLSVAAGGATSASDLTGDSSSSTSSSMDDGSSSTTEGAASGSGTTEPGASTSSSDPSVGQPGQSSTTASPTTQGPSSTTSPTTARPSSTTPGSGGRFGTLGVGAALPSGNDCAARVRPAPETRPGNASYNSTPGNGSHDIYPRVDGNFTGTTDEIIQWAACKWGIDEDIVRAQAAIESWWDMTAGGDTTSDQSACHPRLRTSSGECPESIGLLQVRYLYHGEAFENENAIRSTAYNLDYTYAVMRDCFEGGSGWLNDVERGRNYAAGDLEGCLGVWFSGRWYTDRAVGYIGRLNDSRNRRVWETSEFLNY